MLSERAAVQAMHELLDRPTYGPIVRLNHERGVGVYVVGGAVRDVLLGRPVSDVDFVVTGLRPAALERRLRRIGVTQLVGKRFGVYKVRPRRAATAGTDASAAFVDVALPRVEHPTGRGGYTDVRVAADATIPIEEDLARRDFTVNALAFDTGRSVILDPHQSLRDLEQGVIRTVGSATQRFAEDYTRLLRAVRFAVQLGFKIHPTTEEAIRTFATKVGAVDARGRVVPFEIVGKELAVMLAANAVRALELLDTTGLLKEVLPEVERLRGIEQYKKFHPEGDVLVHTKEALERLYVQTGSAGGPTFNEILATLLHDVGKAVRIQIKDLRTNERREVRNPHRFFASAQYDPEHHRVMNIGHAEAGARIARQLLKRLGFARFSRTPLMRFDQAQIVHDIRYHLLQNIEAMRPSKAEQILFYPDGRVRWSLLRVAHADAGGRVPGTLGGDRYRIALDRITRLLSHKLNQAEPKLAPPLLRGADLIELGAEPGPRFAAVLTALRDAQLAGEIQTRQEARTLAQTYLKRVHIRAR